MTRQQEQYKQAVDDLTAAGFQYIGTASCCSSVKKYRRQPYLIKLYKTTAALVLRNSTIANASLEKINELIQRAEATSTP